MWGVCTPTLVTDVLTQTHGMLWSFLLGFSMRSACYLQLVITGMCMHLNIWSSLEVHVLAFLFQEVNSQRDIETVVGLPWLHLCDPLMGTEEGRTVKDLFHSSPKEAPGHMWWTLSTGKRKKKMGLGERKIKMENKKDRRISNKVILQWLYQTESQGAVGLRADSPSLSTHRLCFY